MAAGGPELNSEGQVRPFEVVRLGAANRLLVLTGGVLTFWDAYAEMRRGELPGSTEPIKDFAVPEDERTVVATTSTGSRLPPSPRTTVLVWRLNANRLDDLAGAATSLAVDPHTGKFAATDDAGGLYTWHDRPFVDHAAYGKFVAYASRGHRVVATDYRIFVSDSSGRRSPAISLSGAKIGSLAVSAEAGFVAAAYVTDDGARAVVQVWPLDGVARKGKTTRVPFVVDDLVFSPDGRWLLGVMNAEQTPDEWTRVWRTGDFTAEPFVVRNDGEIKAAYTADSRSVVVAGEDDGTIAVHDYPSGDLERRFGTHPGPVTSVTVSPDGRRVATANEDDPDVRLWDLATGELFATLRGHHLR